MTQASIIQPAAPVSRAISAATMNMPDPIIEPATIMVESKSPSPRFNACFASGCWESISAPIRLAEEALHKAVEFNGISNVDVVLALGEYVQARGRNAAMNCLSVKAGRQRIPGAMQHKSRAL